MQAMTTLTVAVVQVCATEDREANLSKIESLIRRAASAGAELICLPETCYYRGRFSEASAETVPGKTTRFISRLAQELSILIVGFQIMF